jgi:hypothetical protein
MTEQQLVAIARWVFDTCLVFGTTPETASRVAAAFVADLRSATT